MSPNIPILPPTPPPSPADVFADMPALICCGCNKIFSKGGHLWEAEHPSEERGMCVCSEVISPSKNPDDN
jgi:hypothetical protein